MASPEGMVEEIAKLSVEQLRQVKEQVDNEVGVLQDSLANIRTAASRFEMASKALNTLSHQPAGACRSLSLSLSLLGHSWKRGLIVAIGSV
jgi:prefoldin alpha subunit